MISLRQLISILQLACLVGLIGIMGQQNVLAQNAEDGPLIVGLYHNPPFVIAGDKGWDGIGLHLWRDVAEKLDRNYEYLEIQPDKAVDMLEAELVDVVIGGVVTADAERVIDFSHPYHVSSLGTAEPTEQSIREIAAAFFSPRFWRIALWLIIAFLIIGILVWLFERQANGEQFGDGTARGIWAGFWWAGVTMSTIGYGDKVPQTIGGRILALFWMVVAMGITATLTATLTSILTVNSGIGATQFPDDLRRMGVGVVANSESADFLAEERIQFQSFETAETGLEALRQDELDIFVGNAAKLRFINNESMRGMLQVSTTGIDPQQHAFALAAESPLREPINQLLLEQIESPAWQSFTERYIPNSQ